MYSWRVRSSQMQGIKEATFYKCCCRPPSRMFSILIPPSTMISQLILENANEIIRDCTLKDLWIATSLMPPCFLFSGQCRVNLGLISLFFVSSVQQFRSSQFIKQFRLPTSISSRTQQCYCPNVYPTRECQPTRFVRCEFSSLLCCHMNVFNG